MRLRLQKNEMLQMGIVFSYLNCFIHSATQRLCGFYLKLRSNNPRKDNLRFIFNMQFHYDIGLSVGVNSFAIK